MVSVLVIGSKEWTEWIKDKITHRFTVHSPMILQYTLQNLTSDIRLHGELRQYPIHCKIIQNNVKKIYSQQT